MKLPITALTIVIMLTMLPVPVAYSLITASISAVLIIAIAKGAIALKSN